MIELNSPQFFAATVVGLMYASICSSLTLLFLKVVSKSIYHEGMLRRFFSTMPLVSGKLRILGGIGLGDQFFTGSLSSVVTARLLHALFFFVLSLDPLNAVVNFFNTRNYLAIALSIFIVDIIINIIVIAVYLRLMHRAKSS